MSYHIYNTKGIILSERPLREADRIYNILTRELGLVRAQALGVRNINSKLRGSIEPVSLATVSLVRGKEFWRLTSAEHLKKIPRTNPLVLLEKMVVGESPHPELFDTVEKYIDGDETTLVAQILYHLGYLEQSVLGLDKKILIQAINKGIQASHLL